MNIQNLINGCLAVCITLLIFNTFENKDKIVELENALDNSNKMQIESAYRQYVDDFIENDFDAIASHFHPPVNFNTFGSIARTYEEVINQYKDMKANIQEGYAYSIIDDIGIHGMENNKYLVCADYSRYNEKDERLFAGSTHYLYIPTSNGWKMNSLERKERLQNQSCQSSLR